MQSSVRRRVPNRVPTLPCASRDRRSGGWGLLIGLLLGLAAGGAAARSPLEPVTPEMPAIRTADFAVTPPSGEHWVYFQRAVPGYVTFRKQDPLKRQLPGGEHLAFVLEIRAGNFPTHDLTTQAGLEEALKAALHESPGADDSRGMLRTASFVWQDTDCLSYVTAREEPATLDGAQIVLAWAAEGFFCRHPANPSVAVIGQFQERHLAGTPSRLDGVLRDDAQQTLQSVRFLPAR